MFYCNSKRAVTFPVENVSNKLNRAWVAVNVGTVFEIDDAIVDVKRQVAEAVTNWNNRYVMWCVDRRLLDSLSLFICIQFIGKRTITHINSLR